MAGTGSTRDGIGKILKMNIVKIGKFTFILSPSLNIKVFPFFNPDNDQW